MHQHREHYICVCLDHFKDSKGLMPVCRGVQRHEQSTVDTAPVCLLHSKKMPLVILLHIVRHLWLSRRENTANSPLYRSLHVMTHIACGLSEDFKAAKSQLTISTGLEVSVPNLYRQETHRNRASRSAHPATENGTPCMPMAE